MKIDHSPNSQKDLFFTSYSKRLHIPLAMVALVVWAQAAQAENQAHLRFDKGYAAGESLVEQSNGRWKIWLSKFPSPIINSGSSGRTGAFSAGSESRAVGEIDPIDPTTGTVRLDFAAFIPYAKSHSGSYIQVGLGSNASGLPDVVITPSATGLLFSREIGIESTGVQKAYLDGAVFLPPQNRTIHIRCDIDQASKTASIFFSEDDGHSFTKLSASPDGAPFVLESIKANEYDRVFLRLGESTIAGVYFINVSQNPKKQ
jgi:hypothetical protein